jgi:hypothetical protein
MTLRAGLKRWLFSAAARRPAPRPLELYPIDVDAIAAELDLEEKARKLARANLPAPEQTTLSAPEAKATQRIEKARRDYVEWASARLGHLNELLARSDARTSINEAAGADKAFERTASKHLAESAPLVEELAEKVRISGHELEAFRRCNTLERAASYPEGSAAFLRYCVLALMIVFEGALNAFFFSQGLDSGLLGGFIHAAVLAALNLGTAFVLGKSWIPFVVHRRAAPRALGMIAIAAAFFCMVGLGLTIAHFRDALTAEVAEPAAAAWSALRGSPFGLRDISSWLLFAISLAFACAALFDGLFSDDPYPGYGRHDRRARASKEEYLDQLQEIREDLEHLKDEALAVFDQHLERIHTCVVRYEGLIADKQATWLKLKAASANAERCLDALLKTFRDANQLARTDGARPRYFGLPTGLPKLTSPSLEAARDETALAQQRALAARLLGQAPAIKAHIQASFNTQYDMLKPIDEHFALIGVVHEKEPSLATAA